MSGNREAAFRLPNELICDAELSGSARRLAAVLYAHRGKTGGCCKSIRELSALCDMAEGTVKAALRRLIERGYLTRIKKYRYDARRACVVYGKTEYRCAALRHGWTLIPRSDLKLLGIGSSAFSLLLYLRYCAGNGKRAFPSISNMAAAVGIARSTVCEALKVLRTLPILLVRRCRAFNRAFLASSYIFALIHPQPVQLCPAAVPALTVPQSHRELPSSLWQRTVGRLRGLCSFLQEGVVRFLTRL